MVLYLLLGWLLLLFPFAVLIGKGIHHGTSLPEASFPRQMSRSAAAEADLLSA